MHVVRRGLDGLGWIGWNKREMGDGWYDSVGFQGLKI